jgi:hypothetical protein
MRRASGRRVPAAGGLREKAGPSGLQTTAGNLAVRRLLRSTTGPLIQRQPNLKVGSATDKDRRDFVEDAITYFKGSAAYFADPLVKMDRAKFDQIVNGNYAAVVQQEKIIDDDLAGDAALKARLRAAYIAAIRAVITRAAAALSKSEDDLYRENTGRIPLWAWKTPHHMEPGISTPIAEGRTVDLSGNVVVATNGFNITILPDQYVPVLATPAETNVKITWSQIKFKHELSGQQLVTHVDPLTTPTAQIQTTYRQGVNQASSSGYGRGTTKEDVAGGAVDSRSTTLGFHEGMHGLAMMEYLEHHPPPQFGGTARMTKAAFQTKAAQYTAACNAYMAAMQNFHIRNVDCVGTTIDQFGQAHASAQIVLKCGP